MASSPSEHFAPPSTSSHHLYAKPGFSSHRRTLSSNGDQVSSFPSQKGAHRRTYSNNAGELQRILAGSPTVSDRKQPELVPQPPGPVPAHPRSTGFVGMLDAAITYFDEDSSLPPPAVESASDQSAIVSTLQARIAALETENEALKQETKRLSSQRENYITHIGTLNTQLLDLQLAFEEEKLPKEAKIIGKEAMDSLDLSEVKRGGESPKDKKGEGKGNIKGKPPTPSKGNSVRRGNKGSANFP